LAVLVRKRLREKLTDPPVTAADQAPRPSSESSKRRPKAAELR
jgi:hypothetical protein